MDRKLTRSLLLTLTAVVACGDARPPDPAGTPRNLLLITLDTTRADFLGAYQDSLPRRRDGVLAHSPSLDALARQGTRFDLAISSSALTPVSHASILTGLDNREHGLRVLSAASGYRIADGVPTLATVLRAEGYRTVAVHSAFPVASVFGFDRGFDVFESLEARLPDAAEPTWDMRTYQRRSDETTELVLAHLDPASEPYFLWVHYWDPHDALVLPPREFAQEIRSRLEAQEAAPTQAKDRKRRLRYATEVAWVDAQIGRLLAGLDERGLLRNTLVVVTSDHGQGLGDHGWLFHRVLYQEQIRVPLIVSIPGHEQVPAVPDLVRSKDILPTVLDYMGIEAPARVSGRSLRPLIEGGAEQGRIAFASQINGFDVDGRIVRRRPLDDFVYVAMDARWKLVYRPNHPLASELYDLAADPTESHNLYADAHPEVVRLKQALAESAPWVTEPFAPGSDGRVGGPGRETLEALEALGYVQPEGGARSFEAPPWRWTCPDAPGVVRESRADRTGCSTPLVPIVLREG